VRATWQSFLRISVFAIAVTTISWHSLAISFTQAPSMTAAAATPAAVIAMAAVLLFHRLPSPSKGAPPRDSETDYIVAITLLFIGAWVVFWAPARFTDAFWLWRPDIIGLSIAAAGFAALLGGTRFAMWIAPSLVAVSAASIPATGLVLTGFFPSPIRVAAASSLLAVGPLLVARPITRVHIWRRWLGIGVSIGVGVLLAPLLSINTYTVSVIAATITVVGSEIAWHLTTILRHPIHMPDIPIKLSRVLVACVLVAAFAILDATPPTWSSFYATRANSVLLPAHQNLGSFYTVNNLSVSGWILSNPHPNQLVELILTTGKRPADVLTYPLSSLVKTPPTECPNVTEMRIGRIHVQASLYTDSANGFRWQVFTWSWHSPELFQRLSLVVATGPAGIPVPPIAIHPQPIPDALRTLGAFIANRHLICGFPALTPPPYVSKEVRHLAHAVGDKGLIA